jgi:ACR3 family arsenite efflux pump ArsB
MKGSLNIVHSGNRAVAVAAATSNTKIELAISVDVFGMALVSSHALSLID